MLVHMLVSMRAFETYHAENSHFIESTVYRVNFWSPGAAWALDAYVLTEAEDVTEVLRWADEHARGRRFEVFAEMEDEPVGPFESPRTAGLVRLLGSNPNLGEWHEIGRFEKE